MKEITHPVEEFSQGRRNTAPTGPEVDEVLPHIQALREAVAHADEEGVHPKQRDYAWGTVITAGAVIAKMEKLSCSGERGALVREILLDGTRHPDPVHHPEHDGSFDEHQGWSTPAPRVDTAEGLLLLAREASCADPQVLNAIRQLSRDTVPAVRFQVARYLHFLYYTAPDVMWDMIEQIIREEMSRGVLQALLRQPLSRLAGPHADRVTDLVRIIFNSIIDGSGSKEVRKLCTDIFTNLYLWKDQPLAREIIFEIADDPSQYTNEAYEIAFLSRNPLTQGSAESPKVDQDAIRGRAWALIDRIVSKTTERFSQLIEQYPTDIPHASWPVREREEAKRLAELAEGLATELYFASGAFDGQIGDSGDAKPPLGDPEKRRFLQEAGPLLDRLAELGLPGITHHLVQTLEYLVDFDPTSVFLKISRVISASRNSRYPYDPVAMDLIVTLVSRFLATYPQVLRERQECRQALIEILNVFVEVGWPSALRLAYRIEEIYR
jgi:hypothetical protein